MELCGSIPELWGSIPELRGRILEPGAYQSKRRWEGAYLSYGSIPEGE